MDSAVNILYKTVQDLEIYGNAYWEIVKVGSSVQLFHIPAQTMKLTKTGYQQSVGYSNVDFTYEQVFHFRYFTPLSTIYGAPDYLSIINAMSLYDKIMIYNEKFFANNAIPDMAIVVTGGEIDERSKYTIQRFFRDKFQGYENAHKVLFLPVNEGMTVRFEKLQADNQDASFMQLLTQTITDIIACHGVPPRMISIVNQSQLGGGGETEGQMDIFNKAVIAPKQNIITGLFKELQKKTKAFTHEEFDFIPVEYNLEKKDSFSDFMRHI
ncbi:MAG: phage portal protein [Candidatus Cloacimonetes bacterium]|nr:phage portal protein [Candidatus Cloacimonadota bacterium]